MRPPLVLLAVCAISACLLSPSPAAAWTVAEFRLPGSNGYTTYFKFSGRDASVGAIDVPSPLVLVSATYLSKGTFERYRIRARFGSRGRVAVEFRSSGRAKRRLPPRRCHGAPHVLQHGVFVGAVKFHGEGGYTSVDATRAPGAVAILPHWQCRSHKGRSAASRSLVPPVHIPLGLDPEAERFTALEAESDNGRTSFSASGSRPAGRPGETIFTAARLELRPGLSIIRSAFAHGTDETFSFDEALTTASAAPPPPFEGSAAFARNSDGGDTWLGPLTVDFPGAVDVPLAGKSFHARLFRHQGLSE
jgi:hypothetical protein